MNRYSRGFEFTHVAGIVFLLMGFSISLQATHIVGGEMNYTCLGNNQYEVTLTVYRDCFYGNPDAWFDDPAKIGLFDVQGRLVDSLLMPLMNNDTLQAVLSGECQVIPPDVCVHKTTYRDTVELMPILGGYTLAYQRCCRNQTIANIVEPLATGATFSVQISERAIQTCNSNAKFVQFPPIYICVGEPISFDQSASDTEGDSLVYRLCTPLSGGSRSDPIPDPSNHTPYTPVIWNAPTYGVDNMLNGSPGAPPLTINPSTGLLTGTPNTIGQFVVGICVEEYRNGMLISTTRRDFQYNVGVCGRTVSGFFAPEIQCDQRTVQVNNLSQNASEYIWNFGDAAYPDSIVSGVSPAFTYSDYGDYTITLIAEPESQCADTVQHMISLRESGLQAEFNYTRANCDENGLEIQILNLSRSTTSPIISYDYHVLPIGLSSADPAPTFTLSDSGFQQIFLTVTTENGCTDTTSQRIEVDLIDIRLPDTIGVCQGVDLRLNMGADTTDNYLWSPDIGLSDVTAVSPQVNTDSSRTYSVTVTDSSGFCQLMSQVRVEVTAKPPLYSSGDTTICRDSMVLMASTIPEATLIWRSASGIPDELGRGDSLLVYPERPSIYYVEAFLYEGCSTRDTITIFNAQPEVQIVHPPATCQDEDLVLEAELLTPDDVLWMWSPIESERPILEVPTDSSRLFMVQVTNTFGCSAIDSVWTQVLTVPEALVVYSDQDTLPGPGTVLLTAEAIGAETIHWSPADQVDFSDSFITEGEVSATTEFVATAISRNGCSISAGITIYVVARPCDFPYVFLPNAFSPNLDGVNDLLRLRGEQVDAMHLSIYNRWGEKIFESNSPDRAWDGTFEGEKLPPDIYGYRLWVRCFDGVEFRDQGNITLLR